MMDSDSIIGWSLISNKFLKLYFKVLEFLLTNTGVLAGGNVGNDGGRFHKCWCLIPKMTRLILYFEGRCCLKVVIPTKRQTDYSP